MTKITRFLMIMSLSVLQMFVITAAIVSSINDDNSTTHKTAFIRKKRFISDSFSLPRFVQPLHYDIKLVLIDDNNFYGEANIKIYVAEYTRNISFHSDRLGINHQAITLTVGSNGTIYTPIEYSYHIESQMNNIYFNHLLSPKFYHIFIKYTGTISDDLNDRIGFYKTSHTTNKGRKTWVFSTFYRGIGARRVFPCWDEPAMKTTFSLAIKHWKNYVALSSVSEVQNRTEVDGMRLVYFNTSQRISPYHVAIVLFNDISFTAEENHILKFHILFPNIVNNEDTIFAIDVVEIITNFFQVIDVNNMWPAQWLTFIAIPIYPVESVESNALVFHRVEDFIYNQQLDTFGSKLEIARSLAHKVIFHWISNAFTPRKWSYLWVTQALSTMLEIYALEKNPTLSLTLDVIGAMDYCTGQMRHDSLHLDIHGVMNPLIMNVSPNQIESLFSYQYYLKGYLILRMIKDVISPEVFWNITKGYMKEQVISIVFLNYWDCIHTDVTKFNVSNIANISLRNMMHVWATSSSYPVLNVTRDYETSEITIKVMPNSNTSHSNWYIYVTYAMESDIQSTFLGLHKANKSIWFTPSETSHTITANIDDWIIVNIQQIGYYRVQYDDRNWERLAYYLNQCDFYKIHVLNRAQLIDDAYYMLMNGHLDFSIFTNLTLFLKHDPSFTVWYPMIKIFEYISGFIPFAESEEIRIHMDNIFSDLFESIKYNEQPFEDELTKTLRLETYKWWCIISEEILCKSRAYSILKEYLRNKNDNFLPGYTEWTFCNGLKIAHKHVWYKILDLWRVTQNEKYLRYLACSENNEIIKNYLKLQMSDDNITKLSPRDHANIFLYTVARHADNFRILFFILDNFLTVKPREMSTSVAFNVLINYVYSTYYLNLLKITAKKYSTTEKEFTNIEWKIKRREYQIETLLVNFQRLTTRKNK